MKKIVVSILTMLSLLFAVSCSKPVAEKPKYLWMSADANFKRFLTKDSVTHYLLKAKETGFNAVVVDVKALNGHVLYNSEILPQLTSYRGVTSEGRDWDYLQFFIDEAHRLGMKVTASAVIMPLGQPYRGWNNGIVYDDSVRWAGKTCIERLDNDKYLDIKYDPTKVGSFLNPAIKENCEFAVEFMKEIVTKYEVDGVALDYCRFADASSDFSDASKVAFEEYLGETVENFPNDIFTFDEKGEKVPGKFYKQWWAWRAKLISDLVKTISTEVKAIRPGIIVEYWAASWIHALYQTGQNWASPNSDFALDYPEWGSEEYKATGFAPYLDHFQLGAYLEKVWGADDNESIEYAINRANKLVGDDCLMLGTIYGENHRDLFADAVYLCLSRSAGLMVFDLYQVQKYDLWAKIKEGIDRAENEAK